MATWILRGGRVIDPVNGIDDCRDVTVVDGRVAATGTAGSADVHIIDVGGLVVCPGFVDLHVHLRDPGQTHKEDIATGTAAAAAGGFTTVLAMPNTSPAADCPAVVADILARARECAHVHVLQSACLTVGRGGTELTDAAALRDAGAAALTDDGICIQDAALALRALEAAREAGLPYVEHCEDAAVAAGGVIHAGEAAERLGLPGQCCIVEELVVARDAVLAGHARWPVHIQHISCAMSVAQVRHAQARGVPITAEATPHHLCLTESACEQHGANAKMNPPLRTERDRRALIEGLSDGTICAIATDHAPHADHEKAGGLAAGAFGIIGLETAVPLCISELYHAGYMSLNDVIAALTSGPRRVLGRPVGALGVGGVADVVVLDPDAENTIDLDASRSKSRNSPFHGRRCHGRIMATMVAGRWVYSALDGVEGRV